MSIVLSDDDLKANRRSILVASSIIIAVSHTTFFSNEMTIFSLSFQVSPSSLIIGTKLVLTYLMAVFFVSNRATWLSSEASRLTRQKEQTEVVKAETQSRASEEIDDLEKVLPRVRAGGKTLGAFEPSTLDPKTLSQRTNEIADSKMFEGMMDEQRRAAFSKAIAKLVSSSSRLDNAEIKARAKIEELEKKAEDARKAADSWERYRRVHAPIGLGVFALIYGKPFAELTSGAYSDFVDWVSVVTA